MKIITSDNEIDFTEIENQHLDSWLNKIESGLKYNILYSQGNIKKFFEEILINKEKILVGKPHELKQIIAVVENCKILINKNEYVSFKVDSKLKEIFNYDDFIKSYLPHWGAYKYVKELNINSCVYCNRIFTFTLDRIDLHRTFNKTRSKKEKRRILKNIQSSKTRPELDHFYPKSKFPYLGVSIYNLVPSCHICNSNLKGSRNIDFDKYINPFEDDFDEIMKINARLRNENEIQERIDNGTLTGEIKDHFGYSLFIGKLESFDLKFERTNIDDSIENFKAENHIELYALNELYNMHKDHALRILKNAIHHGAGSSNEIFSRHPNLFHSKEEVKSSILGLNSNPNKINQFPLSKLTIDITKSFGI